ncbi:hypothetical protein J3454_09715 [Erythrobacter sp. NFXS35]|uniref:hypothetical protein n=1 Tax=Erythrobacter sp. NFXS35 TaxID=2818436 RepID=UPI0032DF8377
MLVSKLQYQPPRLKVFGSTRDVLLSDASPQVRQAVRELSDEGRKILRSGNTEQV